MSGHEEIVAELAIRNLVARMAQVTDGGDLESYGAMLAPDTRWVMPGRDAVVGRDNIVAASRERRGAGGVGPGSGNRHIVTTTTVDLQLDKGTAAGISYWLFVSSSGEAPVIRASGVYHDTFVLTEGGWLFSERIGSA